jgi:hypothetical protein
MKRRLLAMLVIVNPEGASLDSKSGQSLAGLFRAEIRVQNECIFTFSKTVP